MAMKIAITAYVDVCDLCEHDQERKFPYKFVDECNQMTFSGQVLNPSFQFLIFAHPQISHLIDRYENVTVFDYEAPNEPYYQIDQKFAKSLCFYWENHNKFEQFDFVIKTDTDVFFTPWINQYAFDCENVYAGLGHYDHGTSTAEDITRMAQKYGYSNFNRISGMHSTIASNPRNMYKIMKLSDSLAKRLYYGLPTAGEWGKSIFRGERGEEPGTGNNSGICTMYSAEIVITALFDKKNIVVTDAIDAFSPEGKHVANAIHIHQYHHDYIYSKHQAMLGHYLNFDITGKIYTIPEFCLHMHTSRRKCGEKTPQLFNKPNLSVFKTPYKEQKYTYPYFSWDKNKQRHYYD